MGHVRYTNRAAVALYSSTLGFEINDIEKGYYADKEDAYDMRKMLPAGLKKQEAGAKKKNKPDKEALKDKDKENASKPATAENNKDVKADAEKPDEGALAEEQAATEEAKKKANNRKKKGK